MTAGFFLFSEYTTDLNASLIVLAELKPCKILAFIIFVYYILVITEMVKIYREALPKLCRQVYVEEVILLYIGLCVYITYHLKYIHVHLEDD